MTVRQLLLKLQGAKPEAEVRVAYDSGCAYSDAKSVEFSTRDRRSEVAGRHAPLARRYRYEEDR